MATSIPSTSPKLDEKLSTDSQSQLDRGQGAEREGTSTVRNFDSQSGQRLGHVYGSQMDSETISQLGKAVSRPPGYHPNPPSSLIDLAMALYEQFEQEGDLQTLNEAVMLLRQAVASLPASHPRRSGECNNLGTLLYTRYTQTGEIHDLDEASSLYREALHLRPAPDPNRGTSINNLAAVLYKRYQQAGDISDLDEAIPLLRNALHLRPAPDPNRGTSLNNLAIALHDRFERSGSIHDLDGAISLHREALELIPSPNPNRGGSLSNLADTLYERFQQAGNIHDLDEAISLLRKAFHLQPANHPDRASSLNNLANVLCELYKQTGSIHDLDDAILLHRDALHLLPAQNPSRPTPLSNLATAMHERFRYAGDITDLDNAIALHREVLHLRPERHPGRPSSLSSLSNTLHERYKQTGDIHDLDDAISLQRDALSLLLAPNHIRASSLSYLGIVLYERFAKAGNILDLNEAITHHREALQLRLVPHPNRASSLNNLANTLNHRFTRTGDIHDLDDAISLHREALDLLPVTHSDRALSLSNLANPLHDRFQQTGQRQDLDEAIITTRDSLQALPQDHPHTCTTSMHLGMLLVDLYVLTQSPGDLDDAVAAFRAAVQCEAAPVSERFRAARKWANRADPPHSSALEAYQTAIGLLPRLAMLGLDLQSRQRALKSQTDGLARDAAAYAIRAGHLEKAVEFLEEGRAIFWTQALQLRTPLDELASVAPEITRKLKNISRALEQGALRDVSRTLEDTTERVTSREKEVIQYRQLNVQWLATVEEARKLEGFQDFLRAKSFATLSTAAANGPVVILNASESECAALVMTSSRHPVHVPLPEFTLDTAKELIQMIQTQPGASYPLGRGERDPYRTSLDGSPDHIFQTVLAILWRLVVQPVLRSLNLEESKSPPRLWWCPTGPFVSLPIHAAGLYDAGKSEAVFDYVISSYTPTLSTLLASPSLTDPQEPFKMLVAIQPNTKGQHSLPCTIEELHKIDRHVPSENLVRFGVKEAPAYVDKILLELPTSSIVHFACHGHQNVNNPLESSLFLEDCRLKVSRLMELPMKNASLVFLSACQTAMGSEELPDEVIHIAATLLFAGFRGAVATMWSIKDRDGPTIADGFYGDLFSTTGSTTTNTPRIPPDTTLAAHALHHAVAMLRAEPGCSFVRWVPFIHMGM